MADDPLRALRRLAADRTFFPPVTLDAALDRLGFVQADPIRAPARAQDLILRQRVDGYRAGDLERRYPSLPVVEEMLHVYGFLHRRLRNLLHPRKIARRWHVEDTHPRLRRAILAHLLVHGPSHPRDIERALIAARVVHPDRKGIINAWGGNSNAATRMLEVLHHRGLLHVARRDSGVRVYALASAGEGANLTPNQRADGLVRLLVDLYAPLPKSSLVHLTYLLHDRGLPRDAMHARMDRMFRRGALTSRVVDGVAYVDTADAPPVERRDDGPRVRFLAPFDPLTWDRRRFRHLFGWDYRFEAYTPEAKRLYGYYALPLVFDDGDDVRAVGWVNAGMVEGRGGRRLAVKAGWAAGRPRHPAFKAAFDDEVERLRFFLAKEEPAA